MLEKAPAVRSLQDGCRRLGLPIHTAEQLVQFLTIKRQHDCITAGQGMRMSPGAAIDRLWHWMLLNTAVSSQVHELVGGVVEHRGTDEQDLTEQEKLVQRLYSINIMRLEGREPVLDLWTEPGTLLSSISQTRKVASLESRPGGGKLMITPTLSTQHMQQLTAAIAQLYSSSTGFADVATAAATAAAARGGGGAAPPGAPPAAGLSAASPLPQPAAAAAASASSRKRSAAQQADMFKIIVRSPAGKDTPMAVCSADTIFDIKQRYEALEGLPVDKQRLVFDGRRPSGSCTVAECGIEPGDTLDIFINMVGC